MNENELTPEMPIGGTDTTGIKGIFIDEWYANCHSKGMTTEQALYAAQQYVYQLGAYDAIKVYEVIDFLARASGTTIDILCQNPDFARFATQTKNAIWANEQKEKGIMQRAAYLDTSNTVKGMLADIDEIIASNGLVDTITRRFSEIQDIINKTAQTTAVEKRVRTSKELWDRMKNRPQGYASSVFGITFPVDTLSFIGARMSRGKTAALTSIAIDALFPPVDNDGNKDEPHDVLFITREETDAQIARRLTLCKAWRDNAYTMTNDGHNLGEQLLNIENPYWKEGKSEQDKHDPKQCFNAWIKGHLKHTPNNDLFIEVVSKAWNEVTQAIDDKHLVIFDGAGASALEERAYINKITERTVMLYDYIQLAPIEGGIAADAWAKKGAIAAADQAIITAMKEKRGIAIAGAQFNRQSQLGYNNKRDEPKRDKLSEDGFADCGNLENDAHIAIGIGWEKDGNGEVVKRFWGLLKNREGGISAEKDMDARGLGYSYLKSTGELASKYEKKDKKDEVKEETPEETRARLEANLAKTKKNAKGWR